MRNHMPKLVAFIVSIFVVIGMIPGIAAASDHDHDSHSHDHDRQSAEVTKQNKQDSDSADKSDAPKPTDVSKTPDKPKADDQSTHQVDKVEVPTLPASTPDANPTPVTPANPSTTDDPGESHDYKVSATLHLHDCDTSNPTASATVSYIPGQHPSELIEPYVIVDGDFSVRTPFPKNGNGYNHSVEVANLDMTKAQVIITVVHHNGADPDDLDDRQSVTLDMQFCPIHHPTPPPENPPPTTPPVAPPLPAENVAKAWVECDSGVHTLRTQLVSGDSNVTFSPESGHKLANGETVEVIASWPNAGQAQKITVTAPANGCTTPATATTANTTSLAMTGAGDGLRTFGFSAIGALVIGLFALWYTKERRKLNQKA